MIILDATTKSLELVLSGAVATTQLDWVCSYVDVTTPTTAPTGFTSGETDGTSNNTSTVVVLAAPASTHQRQVKFLSVTNIDTAAATVQIKYNNNSTRRLIYGATLGIGYTLTYTDGDGWRVWTTVGALLTATSSGLVQTASVTLTNTQIQALQTTPITIIAAPGSGNRIKLLGVTLNLNTSAGAYGNVNATSANLVAQVIGGWWLSAPIANDSAYGLTQLTDLLTNTQQRVVDLQLPTVFTANKTSTQLDGYVTYLDPVAGLPAPADVNNAVIELGATNNGAGDWNAGHANNTLKVTSTYLVEPV